MANELMKINPQAITETVSMLPEVTAWIQSQHDKGLAAGQELIDTIQSNGGQLTAELYEEVGIYIEKTKKLKALMNTKRSPVTQIMDSYRKVFTEMERDVDVTAQQSIPFVLQGYRNRYAAAIQQKQMEEQRKRQAEGMRAQALEYYKQQVAAEFRSRVTAMINQQVGYIKNSFNRCTLENFDAVKEYITNMQEHFTNDMMIGNLIQPNGEGCSQVPLPAGFPDDYNFIQVRMQVYSPLCIEMDSQYNRQVKSSKQTYLDIMPQKKQQLELARTNAEEAKKRETEMKAYEQQKAMELQQEQARQAEMAQQKAQMESKQAIATSLFGDMEQASQIPAVKTKTKKVLRITSPEGFLPLLTYWWSNEGCHQSVEDLSKTFKKMITYAEKAANGKSQDMVQGEGIAWEYEVTAK